MTSWVLQRVGCDNILGSNALEDSCGVCKGNNSDCTTHKGLYAKDHHINREYGAASAGAEQRGLQRDPLGGKNLEWDENSRC